MQLCSLNEILHTLDPHYAQTPYLLIPLLAKFICKPQVNICCSSVVIHGHEQSDPLKTHNPS